MTLSRRSVWQGLLSAPMVAPLLGGAHAADGPAFRFIGAAPAQTPALSYFYLSNPLRLDQELGIKTDFQTVAGSSLSTQLVSNGQGELATISPLDLMLMKQKQPDLPVRAVYKLDVVNGNNIGIPADSPLKMIADLKGKAIGVQGLASVTVAHAKAMLRAAGVDPADVALLPVGIGGQAMAALKTGQVQALCLQRSQFGGIENLGYQFQYFWPPGSSSFIVTNEETLSKRRKDLVRALQIVTMSIAFTQLNPEATVSYFWQVAGKPAGDPSKALKDAMHIVSRNVELWKPISDPQPWGAITDADWQITKNFLGADSGVDLNAIDVSKLYAADLASEINALDLSKITKAAKEWVRPT